MMKKTLSLALLLTYVLAASSTANKLELPNLHLVNMTIFRGAQPQPEGLKKLVQMRIRTIINLRGSSDMTYNEGKMAEELGLKYFNLPLPALSSPNMEEINKILAVMRNSENTPVFVHCKNGDDRTGTIIACYRMAYEGWSDDQAIAEARKVGLSRFQFGMKGFIRNYYQQLQARRNGK